MKFVDVSYFFNDTTDADALLRAHAANIGYLDFLPADWEVHVVKLLRKETQIKNFHFFRTFLKANRFIANLKPDVVLVHGFIFQKQLLALKLLLPGKTKIIIQHHAEQPRRVLADRFVSGYLFSAKELAEPWKLPKEKVFEVMEGSTTLQKQDKQESRRRLGIGEGQVFLWVGQLIPRKDPLTVLTAFKKYNSGAKLYMIYQNDELLEQVKQMSVDGVELIGKVEHSELAYWYSAADYFISGSHSEGSGYSLIEAMSCGCIPIVTGIPSFRKITGGAAVFKPGDVDSLYQLLLNVPKHRDVLKQFEEELSFKAIARQLVQTISSLP